MKTIQTETPPAHRVPVFEDTMNDDQLETKILFAATQFVGLKLKAVGIEDNNVAKHVASILIQHAQVKSGFKVMELMKHYSQVAEKYPETSKFIIDVFKHKKDGMSNSQVYYKFKVKERGQMGFIS